MARAVRSVGEHTATGCCAPMELPGRYGVWSDRVTKKAGCGMEGSVHLACVSHMGRVRGNNEDNFYFAGKILPEENTGSGELLVFSAEPVGAPVTVAVFDGMGGGAKGETAAFLAAQTLRDLLNEDPEVGSPTVFERMNQTVFREAARHRISAMGCTAVMARFLGKQVEVSNVGDSRAFLLREGRLTQLSLDHTDASLLKELGITHRKPRLTQHVGIDPEEMMIEPYILRRTLEAGDRLLLCSDGLTDMVSEQALAEQLAPDRAPAETVRALLDMALNNGGRDNTTMIVAAV